jgi:integrase
MGIRKEYIKKDRIVVPADSERTKVRWNKRHLSHMAQVIPITPEIAGILEDLQRVGPQYGDAEVWLFPSSDSESGHMEEERAAALRLRAHAGVRFTLHQLRHNVATAAEELGYSKPEIKELLGQGTETVTDRYIDERVKLQREQLVAVRAKLDQMMIEVVKTDSFERQSSVSNSVAA